VTTQCVCSRACRAARDRKLARIRRAKDIEGYRADEQRRQRESRKARAKRLAVAGAEPAPAPAGIGCHAPPSASKSPDFQKEIAQIVDRVLAQSRATLERELRRIWPHASEIVARPGAVSRASFRSQVLDSEGKSGAIVAGRHA
jgi:hypothetical protein